GGRPPRAKNAGEAPAADRNRTGAGQSQKPPPADTRHHPSSLASRRILPSRKIFKSNSPKAQVASGHRATERADASRLGEEGVRSGIDLHELPMGPLDGILGR